MPVTQTRFKIIIVTFFFANLLSSCFCSCNCSTCNGCAIMVARDNQTGLLVERKKYCTENNFLTDTLVNDSCVKFIDRHRGINVVNRVDSTFNCEKKDHITCKEAGKLRDFKCDCFK